nr:unnamed protein product [Callosobruchus chinensis]
MLRSLMTLIKLNQNPKYKKAFHKFTREYIDLGHVENIGNQKNITHECEKEYSDISEVIKSDFYVDYLLTGASTIEEAVRVSQQSLESVRAAKTLGLIWCPNSDYLTNDLKNIPNDGKVKILLQALWLEKVSWDDPLPSHITAKGDKFKSKIKYLNLLHANCYIFSRTAALSNGIKVPPLKTITLPRRELCGALLAARLDNNSSKSLKLDNETMSSHTWKYVPSALNYADLISPEMKPSEIHSAKIWRRGPAFLKPSEFEWHPNPCQTIDDLPDIKRKTVQYFFASKSERFNLFDKYSNLTKLERVTALLLRFIQNCRKTK